MEKKRIVIVGSGFAGVYAYLELHKKIKNRNDIEVVLVSKEDHFLFIPLLHEVATGNLAPHSIQQPLMSLPQDKLSDVILGTVSRLDPDSQTILISYDEGRQDTLSYDYLIMGLGSETAYYGVEGAEAHTFPLKSLYDAKLIKNTVISRFEEAQYSDNDAHIESLLRFVLVGGGPTGVEFAGELSDFIYRDLVRAYPGLTRRASIILTDGASRACRMLPEWFSKNVEKVLKRKRVSVCLNAPVTEVRPDGIMVDSSFITTRMVVWAAGVRARDITIDSQKEVLKDPKTQRVHVTSYLSLEAYENAYIVGDQASLVDKETHQPYTMRAQFAVRQGECAARNILSSIDGKRREEFFWQDKGIILSLGDKGALGEIYGIRFKGVFAWVLYRAAYLSKMYGSRMKIRTLTEWILNLWAPRDISKI